MLPGAFMAPLCAAKWLEWGRQCAVVLTWTAFPTTARLLPCPLRWLPRASCPPWLAEQLPYFSLSLLPQVSALLCSWKLRLGPSREPLGFFKETPGRNSAWQGPAGLPEPVREPFSGGRTGWTALLLAPLPPLCPASPPPLPPQYTHTLKGLLFADNRVWLLSEGCQKNTGSLVQFEFQMNNNR